MPTSTKADQINESILYPEYGMCKLNVVDFSHPITQSEPDSAWMLYYWRPELIPNKDTSVAILGRYDKGNKDPAIVALEYGLGRVFIIGTHPEFQEDSDRDGVDFADEFDDRGSDWKLMKKLRFKLCGAYWDPASIVAKLRK
ncbi:hypothetical protein DRQ00_11760 [candidate division KSB1 bacterium]|nr:MAG: hypothetical protein DRQ00_11760 [candidate division KSB1 bacterium]